MMTIQEEIMTSPVDNTTSRAINDIEDGTAVVGDGDKLQPEHDPDDKRAVIDLDFYKDGRRQRANSSSTVASSISFKSEISAVYHPFQYLPSKVTLKEESEDKDTAKQTEKIERCLTIKLAWKNQTLLYFNPRTYFLSYTLIWAIVIWSMVEPEESLRFLKRGQTWITHVWTWLYVATQNIWVISILILYFHPYADMKLGKPNKSRKNDGDLENDNKECKPEYSDMTYLAMIFSCGIGIGYLYYGVAEPIFHYTSTTNRYQGRYNDNQRAQDAINLTLFHWGLHGWVGYMTIGILLAFLCHRRGMPMTLRILFHPLIGDRVYGVIGDLIDTLSIVTTMFGICTSLGLGVRQINAGITYLLPTVPNDQTVQVIAVWVIIIIATISVISGVNWGIRRWSQLFFGLSWVFILINLFHDQTWFILNLIVQSTGYYFQWLVQLGFHTDAFAQLDMAPDGQDDPSWMTGWTIFYWGWWISWSPFVGVFIAKISKNRTIKEFITYTLILPCVQCLIWFCVFGGSAIRLQNMADNQNVNCSMYKEPVGNPSYSSRQAELFARYNTTKYSCRNLENMWFDHMFSYGSLGTFMSVISLIMIVLGFTTSSDSASLAIDIISSNGHPDPPVIQRILWSATEGATATALLVAGGQESLKALQSVAIICGLPFTFVMNWTCVAMWKVFREEAKREMIGISDHRWVCGVLELNSVRKLQTFIISIFCPWIILTEVRMKLDKTNSVGVRICNYIFYSLPFYIWVILLICSVAVKGLSYVGWAFLIFFFVFASAVRGEVRELYHIDGNVFEDIFSFVLLYPLACMQLSEQYLHGPAPVEITDKVVKLESISRYPLSPPPYEEGVINPVFNLAES